MFHSRVEPIKHTQSAVAATVVGLTSFSVGELEALGVRRISVGSALSRAALASVATATAAREMIADGTFTFAEEAIPYRDVNRLTHERT